MDEERRDEALEDLGDLRDAYEALEEDPEGLFGALRESVDLQVAMARADIRPHLRAWFTETVDWQNDPQTSGVVGPGAAGVEWMWQGVHDKDGTFNGLSPSGREIVVRGFTLIGIEEGRLVLRRYIDWAGLYEQLGLALSWRLPLPTLAEDADEPTIPSP